MDRYQYLKYLVNYINFECILNVHKCANVFRMKRVLSVLPIYVD